MKTSFQMSEELRATFQKQDVRFAYLFGSYAQGNEHSSSDIDIAVMLPSELPENERLDRRLILMTELSRILKKPVDLVVLNDIRSLFFKYIIIKEGVALYEAPDVERAEFECRLMGEYFDFAPFLESYNRAYVERNV